MTLAFVLPAGIDDETRPSGGNRYDRRLADALTVAGIAVREITVPGAWPTPGDSARAALGQALADLPDGTTVLLDGLVAGGVPEVVGPAGKRLRVAVLVHLPLADEIGIDPSLAADLDGRERAVLHGVGTVIATSEWAAHRLVEHHGLLPDRVHAVPPGVDPAPVATGTDGRSRLLCVASVTPRKGHDLLVEALAAVADRPWTCVCAGPFDHTGEHVALVRGLIDRHRLGDRIRLAGPLAGARLAAEYDRADLVVLASRAETFGMVLTEAIARGIPVLATDVDAVPATVGRDRHGKVPGLLVPAGELGVALRQWLDDGSLRERLRAAARSRRGMLEPWSDTARRMAGVLNLR